MGVVGKPHLYAQQRLVNIVNARGYEASMEVPNPLTVDDGRKKVKVPFVYDVYFQIDENWAVDIEVDGKLGHSTSRAVPFSLAYRSQSAALHVQMVWSIMTHAMTAKLSR